MNRPPYPSSPSQAKAWFKRHGICISDWANQHGTDRYTVFDLLRGKRVGDRGATHKAAVLLGLKEDPNVADAEVACASTTPQIIPNETGEAVAIAFERYRCALINHRLQAGSAMSAVMHEFQIQQAEVEMAVDAHKANVSLMQKSA